MKKLPTLVALFALAVSALAEDSKPLLHDHALPVLATPDFKAPLDASFSIAKGKWTVEDGVMSVLDLPEQKHIPVLHHMVGLASATIEVEFLIEGPGTFLVGCDSDKHVGRVVVAATGLSIAEDSVKPSHTIAKLPMTVKPNEWHKLRVEWRGDQMAANLDGQELKAQHPYFATPKARSWLAAGKSVKVRNLKISGETKPMKGCDRMRFFGGLFMLLGVLAGDIHSAEPQTLLEEPFTSELSKDWFWGLGTWTAKDGVLRGFESGPRRHGPVKMRKFLIKDAIIECDFRLEGKATFAGIIFNGPQERGHIVHLVIGADTLRILAHPKMGEHVDLLKQPNRLAVGEWHHVKIEFKGETITAMIDAKTFTAHHPCIAEEKQTFGLGGDSGGAEGEKAGALEFRRLKIVGSP